MEPMADWDDMEPWEDLIILGFMPPNMSSHWNPRTGIHQRLHTVIRYSNRQLFGLYWQCIPNAAQMARDRRIWRRNRHLWWGRNVYTTTMDTRYWDQKVFKENMRMERRTFRNLCIDLAPYIEREDTHLRNAISVEVRVGVALMKLAGSSGYLIISNLFCVGRTSAGEITFEVCNILYGTLKGDYITWPTGDEAVAVCEGFRTERGMPQVIGAIDGTHIPIYGIEGERKKYFNYKKYYSITVQAVVDYRYRFTDVVVGWPGAVHDARVFHNSDLAMNLEMAIPNTRRQVGGQMIRPVLIGDGAYPLSKFLMKPYPGRHLDDERLLFNYRLSSARMVVENAFGRLKGRWRILFNPNECSLDGIKAMTGACLVLHNICESQGDEPEEDWPVDEEHNDDEDNDEVIQPLTAHGVRNAFMHYFNLNLW